MAITNLHNSQCYATNFNFNKNQEQNKLWAVIINSISVTSDRKKPGEHYSL